MAVGELAAERAGNVERVQFTGRAGEYFGIWIVNILLTIVTLGIYSAWAKVRRKRYFLGNTSLMGRNFDYHAAPKKILIGRLIVFGMLVVYNILLHVAPPLGVMVGLAIFISLPWFIHRSLRFNARVTSYGNVRFDFVGKLGGAYKAFFWGYILLIITAGICAPIATKWAAEYVGGNLRYAGRAFDTRPRTGPLYMNLLISVGSVVVAFVAIFVLGVITGFAMPSVSYDSAGEGAKAVFAVLMTVPLVLGYAFAVLSYYIGARNITWSATTVDGIHKVVSDVPRLSYFAVAVTNLIATFLTLGLMRPWAAVRMSAFLAKYTGLRPGGPIEDIDRTIEDSGSAVGSEFADFEGFDFGF